MLVTSSFSFSTMFSNLWMTSSAFLATFKLWSTNALNVDKSKMSLGKGLSDFSIFYDDRLFGLSLHDSALYCIPIKVIFDVTG